MADRFHRRRPWDSARFAAAVPPARRNPPDEFGAGSSARDGSRPAARQAQEDRAIDRICLRARRHRQRKTCHSQSDCNRGEELIEKMTHTAEPP